ncbi:cytosine deaminase [Agrobacterium vitis]
MIDSSVRAKARSSFTGHGRIIIRQACVPTACLADGVPPGSALDRDGCALVDILLDDGRVAAVLPAASGVTGDGIDLEGRHLWPLMIDMHVHLDKGHTISRAPASDGTHPSARAATTADRQAHWRHDDLVRRMEFGLACADAHGVAALRTHLDSHAGQAETTWAAFDEVQARWSGRIALQAVGLVPLDAYRTDHGKQLADLVARQGGLLGGVTRASGGTHGIGKNGTGLDDIDALLDSLFRLARERDLDIDLHVDEAEKADALPHVARAAIRHGYEGRVTCGHCCSLALFSEAEIRERIALLADAGLSIVTLPTVNMYLQGRAQGITPRWRGVTPVKELRAAGIRVAVAGDNCRDPFFAYGDHDMVDTWRQSVRILHLDHPYDDAVALATTQPAAMTGFSAGTIGAGRPADLMIFEAWSMDQVIARPQTDRVIVRAGRVSEAVLPSYREIELPFLTPSLSSGT